MKNIEMTTFVLIFSGLFITACQQTTTRSSNTKPSIVTKAEKRCE